MQMHRYAMLVEYDGGPFAGWQRQAQGQRSVQGAIEAALAKLEPGEHTIAAAGRTDAGVHGWGQVAHVDLRKDWDPFRLAEALNWHLRPDPIAILRVCAVPADFHARFWAVERSYVFRLVARRAPMTHDKGRVWQTLYPLNLDAMRDAASHLVGHHDFTTFRSTMCQAKSPLKSIDEISIQQVPYAGGMEYRFYLRARSFLHNQVRSIVGTIERVGVGRWAADDVARALAAKDRSACGPVCPPQGLYLSQVRYLVDPFAS
jgi:tRNA pseudouridine38-40 synthase